MDAPRPAVRIFTASALLIGLAVLSAGTDTPRPVQGADGTADPALGALDLREWHRLFLASPLERRIGIQVGHWKLDELPAELERLKASPGARYGEIDETRVNLAIAGSLAEMLESSGIRVDILPATVPPGYFADALIAIHADGANRPGARGWKIASPWRGSHASKLLEQAMALRYGSITGLPEDVYGVTEGMRGYYAFSPHRVHHAASSLTPAVIVETGFLTVKQDRAVIVDHPEVVAKALTVGILRYFAAVKGTSREDRLPRSYAPLRTSSAGITLLHARPGETEPVVARLASETPVLPVASHGGWVEVVVRGQYRTFGWTQAHLLSPLE